MSDSIKQAVLQQLAKVKGPDLEGDLVSLGLVSDVFVSDGRVAFSITVPADRAQELEPLRQAAENVVREVPGVGDAMVALPAVRAAGSKAPGRPDGCPIAPARAEGHGSSRPRERGRGRWRRQRWAWFASGVEVGWAHGAKAGCPVELTRRSVPHRRTSRGAICR